MYDVFCAALQPDCIANGATFIFRNNISVGFPDSGNGGKLASGIYWGSGSPLGNAGSAVSNNLWYSMNTGCPDSGNAPYETVFTCGDPLLKGESNVDAINPMLNPGSPAIGAGFTIPGITTDYQGKTRPAPPSIGAMEQ
jgi:hypothetical protein